jgi:hypothetical protein
LLPAFRRQTPELSQRSGEDFGEMALIGKAADQADLAQIAVAPAQKLLGKLFYRLGRLQYVPTGQKAPFRTKVEA